MDRLYWVNPGTTVTINNRQLHAPRPHSTPPRPRRSSTTRRAPCSRPTRSVRSCSRRPPTPPTSTPAILPTAWRCGRRSTRRGSPTPVAATSTALSASSVTSTHNECRARTSHRLTDSPTDSSTTSHGFRDRSRGSGRTKQRSIRSSPASLPDLRPPRTRGDQPRPTDTHQRIDPLETERSASAMSDIVELFALVFDFARSSARALRPTTTSSSPSSSINPPSPRTCERLAGR